MNPIRTFRLISVALITALALLSLPILIYAIAPTATTWYDFSPGFDEWISQLPATTAITTHSPDDLTDQAEYQFSTDGGTSWSGWQTANLTVGALLSDTRRITVSNLTLTDGANFIQYRITDGNGQTDNSPAFPVNVDTTAPGSAIDPQAVPETWTNINSFGATWTNPSDANGIGGVWYKVGATPSAPEDGLFVVGDDITSLSGLSVGGDGVHTLWLWLQDRVENGDHTTAISVPLRLDTVPPAALSNPSVAPNTWSNVNAFNLKWTAANDDSGLSGVQSTIGQPPLLAEEGEFLAGTETGYEGYAIPGDEEGVHQLWLWPVDGAGNFGDPIEAVSLTLNLDLTPPGPPLTLPAVSPSGWQTATTATYTVTWQNPADLSGIASACYKLGSEPEHDTDGVCEQAEAISTIDGIAASGPGSYHLFLWLGDTAGNIDKDSRQVALDAVMWDPEPPELFVDVIGPVGNNEWYTGSIDITIIASDVGSGLDRVEYNLDDEEWIEDQQHLIEEDGEHLLQVRAVDKAGNNTAPEPLEFNLDQEAPITDPALDRLPVFDDWYDNIVTIWFNLLDLVSGPDYVEWQLDEGEWQQESSMTISNEGEHTLSYMATDLAGNLEETQELAVHVDLQPPVTSYVILPGDNNAGWYTKTVTVTLVPADEGSGVQATYYRIDGGEWISGTVFSLNESGEYVVDVYSVDRIGYEEPPHSLPDGIRIDTDAPWPPTPIDLMPKGWTHTNEFELIMAMPPDLSGIGGAYYKVGDAPIDAADGTWREGGNNVLRDIQTPAEGIYKAYVWLQDGAGNADHNQRGVWEEELSLAYDATAPTTTALLQGIPGNNDWFVSPVSVTLVATDSLSGVNETYVSIDGSQPLPTTQFVLSSSDKHTLRYSSTDIAGNVEEAVFETVRIDPDPPGSPQAVTVSPGDWSQINSFSLSWTNPADTSGIAAGYYKLGNPPAYPLDGIRIPPIGISAGIEVPDEGAWDLHFWLEDHAGNADINSRVVKTSALRFDNTAPATLATLLSGTLAPSGWYITPVTVQLTASDGASGIELIRYRLNDSNWQELSDVSVTVPINITGRHTLSFQAIDVAGNVEPLTQISYQVDLNAPNPSFLPIDRYQRQSSFLLNWRAADEPEGSGLDGFDLQYKDGRNGAWMNWGESNVQDTSGRYFGNFGHRYFFRMRARDLAGNVSRWVGLPWGVYIDVLLNGDFAGSSFGAWQHDGELAQSVIDTQSATDEMVFAARLGSPDYGPNVPGMDIPDESTGIVPVGSGNIVQAIRVPGADVLDYPTLTFWYRIYTYDTAFGQGQQRWFDTFDLKLIGPTGEQLALRDGLPYDMWQEGVLADLGWREASVLLPRSWAGERITIRMESWNRVDGRLNTWSSVTDVRLWDPYRQYLPQLIGGNSTQTTQVSQPRPLDDPRTHSPSGGLR